MSIVKIIKKALCFSFPLSFLSIPALAQEAPITADGTTGTEINTNDGSNFDINGGDKAGGNLFHSFGNFSVPNGGAANFLNSPDIVNIINRVTGGKISDIQGLISAQGSANLFLINPAGIVFGSGAFLNIGGSFLGSTANSLLFNDGTEFSATNPTKPLLTINAPIGLNIRDNPAPITLKNSTTQIDAGKNIGLIGGNISLDNSELSLSGGRIVLGGLSAAGKIIFNQDDSLKFPDNVAKSDISLTNNSFVSLDSVGGGDIAINAKKLNLDNSVLVSGILEGRGIVVDARVGNIDINADSVLLANDSFISSRTFSTGDVGDININAKKEVRLDNSLIANFVGDKGKGNSGNIDISTGSLSLTNDARLVTATLGEGNSGSITINAIDNVALDNSTIGSFTENTGVGKSGNISIAAKNLFISDGGRISTATNGKGDSGNISIKATDNVSIDGIGNSGFRSGIETSTETEGEGNSGSINIDTGSLTLTDDATIRASTFGVGDAGNININANDAVKLSNANIFSAVENEGVGKSGNIDITAKSLSLDGGAQLSAFVSGKGDAGNINLNIADTVNISGQSQQDDRVFLSGIFSNIDPGGEGNAGNINIATGSLNLIDGALINASAFGFGNVGSIRINALKDVKIANSTILNGIENGGVGNGGKIEIVADSLSLQDGGRLSTQVSDADSSLNLLGGKGNAGNINIKANTVSIDGKNKEGFFSGLFSNIGQKAEGNAGTINIASKKISISNGAQISVDQKGIGNGGNLNIFTDFLTLNNKASILGTTNSGEAGNIGINVKDILSIRDNSLIKVEASPNIDGGQLFFNAGFIVAFPSQKPNDGNDIVFNTGQGTGRGGIFGINTQSIFGMQFRPDNPGNGTNDISVANQSIDFSIDDTFAVAEPNLPANTVEPDETVAQACGTNENGEAVNSFTITGRGGLPSDPTEPLNSSILAGNLGAEAHRGEGAEEKKTLSSDEIIPARGVAYNEKGQVVLTRYPTKYASDRPLTQSDYCSTSLQQEKLLAMKEESDRSEEILSDRTVAELMDFLYSLNPEQKK
jgi:filamentous hemagglutinin family protein